MARIRERDLVIPALRAAAASGESTTMTNLIEWLVDEFDPSGDDAVLLDGRNDSRFTQIVRNLVSHRDSPSSMFSRGFAVYHPENESIEITDAGRAFLTQVPDA